MREMEQMVPGHRGKRRSLDLNLGCLSPQIVPFASCPSLCGDIRIQ